MSAVALKPGHPRWRNPALAPNRDDSTWFARVRARCAAASISRVAAELKYPRERLSVALRGREGYVLEIAQRLDELRRAPTRRCPHSGREISRKQCHSLARQSPKSTYPSTIAQLLSCKTCLLRGAHFR